MFFKLEPNSNLPLYEQLFRQVKLAVADGVLAPGQLVPSVRQLATELAINPNTIARAYQQLQGDGVIEPLRGRGLVVCRGAPARCRVARNSIVGDSMRRAIGDAIAGGLTPDELREIFDAELCRMGANGRDRSQAGVGGQASAGGSSDSGSGGDAVPDSGPKSRPVRESNPNPRKIAEPPDDP